MCVMAKIIIPGGIDGDGGNKFSKLFNIYEICDKQDVPKTPIRASSGIDLVIELSCCVSVVGRRRISGIGVGVGMDGCLIAVDLL